MHSEAVVSGPTSKPRDSMDMTDVPGNVLEDAYWMYAYLGKAAGGHALLVKYR